VFVLHDLDVAGFSIFGTLASNGRRYTHMNEVPLINIGLRLTTWRLWICKASA
jgi:hypothetical protein